MRPGYSSYGRALESGSEKDRSSADGAWCDQALTKGFGQVEGHVRLRHERLVSDHLAGPFRRATPVRVIPNVVASR
jgi:hypothetical protein